MIESPASDAVAEIAAMNQLFVDFLRSAPPDERAALGLPADIAALVRAAPPACLATLMEFPRALFELRLPVSQADAAHIPGACAASHQPLLQLSILHGAASLCRRKPFAARLFLGLDEHDVRRLRMFTPTQLLQLAGAGGVLVCGFCASTWLWRKLLTETRPEARRQLLLIAMQPRLPHCAVGAAPGRQMTA